MLSDGILEEVATLCAGPGADGGAFDVDALDGALVALRRQQGRFSYLRGSVVDLMQARGLLPLRTVAQAVPAVRFEAHLNAERMESSLWPKLLGLGFQPDDFLLPHPEVYRRNWTFSFDVPGRIPDNGSRARRARMKFVETCDACERLIETSDTGAAFLEREEVKADTIKVFSSVPTAGAVSLPTLLDELKPIMSETQDKRCDLHVKVKGADGVDGAKPLSELQRSLAAALERSGFYRIVSVSRNTILTAQFLDGGLARKVFDALCNTIGPTGLAASIVLEPCKGLWRKPLAGGARSPMCHLVDLRRSFS